MADEPQQAKRFFGRFASSVNFEFVILVILLVAELEYLLVSNYAIRTELRAVFGLPLYHVFLTFVTLVCILRWLTPNVMVFPKTARWSWPWLAVHSLVYCGLWFHVQSLWNLSMHLQITEILLLWTALGLALMMSWLLIWLPIAQWKELWYSVRTWLWWALLLSFAAPYLAESTSSAWKNFAPLTFELTKLVLGIFYSDVVVDPQRLRLGTSHFVVEVQPGCSGYEGMGLISVLLSGYVWIRRAELKFPLTLVILPIGIILAYYANILRLVALVSLGTEISPDLALRGFHSQAGWLSFTMLSLGLIFILERWRPFFHSPGPTQAYTYEALPFIAPLVTLIAISILVKAFRVDFDYLYFLKPSMVGIAIILCYPGYRPGLATPAFGKSVLVGVSVYIAWITLATSSESVSPFDRLPTAGAYLWIATRWVGAILTVPIAEELAFRGYLLRRLTHKDWKNSPPAELSPLAVIGTSLIFGFMHTDLLAGTLAGIAYSWLASRPGHLSNAILGHATTNACIAVHVVLRRDWGLW